MPTQLIKPFKMAPRSMMTVTLAMTLILKKVIFDFVIAGGISVSWTYLVWVVFISTVVVFEEYLVSYLPLSLSFSSSFMVWGDPMTIQHFRLTWSRYDCDKTSLFGYLWYRNWPFDWNYYQHCRNKSELVKWLLIYLKYLHQLYQKNLK